MKIPMKSIRFAMTVILVDDIDKSKRFYQNLFDFTIQHDFGENIVFEKGFSLWQKHRAHHIIFGRNENNSMKNIKKNTELYFETTNINSVWEIIK